MREEIKSILSSKYTKEELEDMDVDRLGIEVMSIFLSDTEIEVSDTTKEMISDIMHMSMDYILDSMSKKSVWFMISDLYGRYSITMFYDNEYNRANGEDL